MWGEWWGRVATLVFVLGLGPMVGFGPEASHGQAIDLGHVDSIAVVPVTRTVVIGGVDVDPAFAWQRETAMELMSGPGDELFILDRTAQLVRVIGSEGRLRRTIGRVGPGPGEFANPWELGFMGDSLWVWDAGRKVFHVFDPGGAFLSQIRVGAWDGAIPIDPPPVRALLAGGRVVKWGRDQPLQGVQMVPYLVTDRDGTSADTLASIRLPRRGIAFPKYGNLGPFSIPFEHPSVVEVAHGGDGLAVVSWGGSADTLEIAMRRPNGLDRATLKVRYQPVPISRQERDDLFERAVAAAEERREEYALMGMPLPPPSEVRLMVEEALMLPEHWPPISHIRRTRMVPGYGESESGVGSGVAVGRGGVVGLRLRLDREEENRWLIVDASTGGAVGIDVPAGATLRVVEDGYGWATATGEYDIPYLYRFEWGGG